MACTNGSYFRAEAALAVALTLALSSVVSVFAGNRAAASPEEAKWTSVNIPGSGEAGGWVLAPGSDVKRLTTASDNSIYAYANPIGTSNTLFKSTDAGNSWSSVGRVADVIVAIAIARDDASLIYYATASNVYKSADSGKTFSPLPAGPGGAGTANITITSLDIGRLNGKSLVAVGTADNDTGEFGGVYTLDETKLIPAWENSAASGYDVSSVTFSPNYAVDRQLIAVATNEIDTFVTSKVGAGTWAQLIGRATVTGHVARGASSAFPTDYDASLEGSSFFVALDTGINAGDVYRIKEKSAPDSSAAVDLNVGSAYGLPDVDIAGLAVNGQSSAAKLLAGSSTGTQVYASSDGGNTWSRSKKPPTGQSAARIVMASDFVYHRGRLRGYQRPRQRVLPHG